MKINSFFPLFGGVRHYAWGETASGNAVPYIANLLGVDAGTEPWAELWLGAHPSLPSDIAVDGSRRPLGEAIAAQPVEWLGKAAATALTPPQLSFLFKVLACSHPLSIQSHPDEVSAKRLHATKPQLYPDANDKTEIMIALEPFEALAGFRNLQMIRRDLAAVSAFAPLLAAWQSGADAASLKGLCAELFAMEDAPRQTMLAAALTEVAASGRKMNPAEELFVRLSAEYPGDRGTFFAFLLNQITLQPGQALFLAPNTPHAYQRGAGIECMTNSDNVIRAGLTPKTVDVETLMATLNFQDEGAMLLEPDRVSCGTGEVERYVLPTPKFQLAFYRDAPCSVDELGDGIGIFLVVSGRVALSVDGQPVAKAGQGTAWVRPAALKQAAVTPLEPGTLVAWAMPNF
ncbi:MAG: mannose-6-phosphate isomerase, class I [Victivallales bacterium]|nr:mannose-6-phosphate isomerase, class I [Victivallales bacterium]